MIEFVQVAVTALAVVVTAFVVVVGGCLLAIYLALQLGLRGVRSKLESVETPEGLSGSESDE